MGTLDQILYDPFPEEVGQGHPIDFYLAEVITWSWQSSRQNLIKFVAGGILIGLLYGLLTALYGLVLKNLPLDIIPPCLIFGFGVGLVFGLIFVLLRGLSHDRLDKRDILKPNQGIWNSARNSVLLGLLFWLLFSLFFVVLYGWFSSEVLQIFRVSASDYKVLFPQESVQINALAYGLGVGAFFWINSGGEACIQHLLQRVLLWRANYIPRNYPHFLDTMAERLLLRKVGGGYMFTHRLLLEYFAVSK